MSKAIGEDGYPCAPRQLSETAWFYEMRKGINVVAEKREPDGTLVSVVQTVISWRRMCAAVDRHRKVKDKR
jgi:hypothetical protein